MRGDWRETLVSAALLASACAQGNPDDVVRTTGRLTPTPSWYAAGAILTPGPPGSFDEVAVMSPSIAWNGDALVLVYSGIAADGTCQLGLAEARNLEELSSSRRRRLTRLSEPGGSACNPQLFYFEAKKAWYLLYDSSQYGPTYSTSPAVDPDSWTTPQALPIRGGLGSDYWLIADDSSVYLFNTAGDGSGNLHQRSTSITSFPGGWSSHATAVSDTTGGVAVYQSRADDRYYLLAQKVAGEERYALWTAETLGGPWTSVSPDWASAGRILGGDTGWTDRVGKGELLRTRALRELHSDERMRIDDIDRGVFLVQGLAGGLPQGVPPWQLGVISSSGSSCATTPPAPTGLNATPGGSNRIDLTWTGVAPPEGCTVTYTVYRSTTSGNTPGSSERIATGVAATSYSDTGLAATTGYSYHVVADDWAGASSPSTEVSARTGSDIGPCTTVPQAPTGVVATASSGSQIDLSWTPAWRPEGCTVTYTVHRGPHGEFTPSSGTQVATGLSAPRFADAGLAAATRYYYVVQAEDAAGASNGWTRASATTRADSSSAAAAVAPVEDPLKRGGCSTAGASTSAGLLLLLAGLAPRLRRRSLRAG
jgi:hypothetical protein